MKAQFDDIAGSKPKSVDNPTDKKHTCKSGGAPCKQCKKEINRKIDSPLAGQISMLDRSVGW